MKHLSEADLLDILERIRIKMGLPLATEDMSKDLIIAQMELRWDVATAPQKEVQPIICTIHEGTQVILMCDLTRAEVYPDDDCTPDCDEILYSENDILRVTETVVYTTAQELENVGIPCTDGDTLVVVPLSDLMTV